MGGSVKWRAAEPKRTQAISSAPAAAPRRPRVRKTASRAPNAASPETNKAADELWHPAAKAKAEVGRKIELRVMGVGPGLSTAAKCGSVGLKGRAGGCTFAGEGACFAGGGDQVPVR
jgi:hypothetical protein